MSTQQARTGALIKDWRARRRLSQLDLALEAGISQRHLSFVESGRAAPSRDMVLLLAEQLRLPLRERNILLLSAGFAPVYSERPLTDPSMQAALAAVEQVLRGHEPNPALAIDRHWRMVLANAAVAPLLAGVADAALLAPPVNVLRLSLHPGGLAPRIVNYGEWRAHLIGRLRQQIDATADPELMALEQELSAYPAPPRSRGARLPGGGGEPPSIVVPLRLEMAGRVLSFISTTTIFGTPVDVTLSELAVESFFPADPETAALLREAAG